MRTAGLDIGSRTIALVEWDGAGIVRAEVIDTGTDSIARSRRLMDGQVYDRLVATGYGRHLAGERAVADQVITEIKAFALGAWRLYPDVRTVLDIGGQDGKIIRVLPNGGVARFAMNDRCAAGTGRFLETMALVLGLSIADLGEHALEAKGDAVQLSSMCTVFAESEVVSLIGRGEDSRRVALGIHQAIASRISAMVCRVGIEERFLFAGGVARNRCLRVLLEQDLGIPVTMPTSPQTIGALGAALYAEQQLRQVPTEMTK